LLLLDLLVDAPASVAGLYGDLVYYHGHQADVIEPLRVALEQLERREWVFASTESGRRLDPRFDERARLWERYAFWLPMAQREDLPIDGIGLWYELTDAGRRTWKAEVSEPVTEHWELEDETPSRRLWVTAESDEACERVLKSWLDTHPRIQLTSRMAMVVIDFRLRSGRVLARGSQMICAYTESAPRQLSFKKPDA
jgi:hypothetical protein